MHVTLIASVVTRRTDWAPEGVIIAGSISEALAGAEDGEVIGFGGGEIYDQLLDSAERLEITEIDAELDGDVVFPRIDPARWTETERIRRNGYSWVTYCRAHARTGSQ